MHDYDWVFEKTPEMGGATGEAFTNTLLGSGLKTEGTLAREAIQNSCDAIADPTEKVRVVFHRKKLTGEEKSSFFDASSLRGSLFERRQELDLRRGNCLSETNNPESPLKLLYISDFGTYGLHGNPHDSKSHFFRLLFALGDGSKARETGGTGGSYGFGKSVYSANSNISTLFAYSVFKEGPDGVRARLMGCSYFKAHSIGDESYTGRSWFGVPNQGESRVSPFENEQAHELACMLGFEKREADQTGTSILIVDCPVEIDELRTSVEDWWWPRIVVDELDIELLDQNLPAAPPRPRIRTELKPIIDCYDLACFRSEPTIAQSQKSGFFNRMHNTDIGSYGYAVLPPDLSGDESMQDRIATVALIRSPKMVVCYMKIGAYGAPCVGVFVADKAIDDHLKLSEPAAHDRWDPDSSRLDDSNDEHAREFVKSTIDRIKMTLRAFSKDALPPVPPSEIRPKLLEKLLGNLFRPLSKGSNNGGGSPAEPITISFAVPPHIRVDGDKLKTASKVEVGLAPDFENDTAEIILEIRCIVIEDEKNDGKEDIPVNVECSDVDNEPVEDSETMSLRVTLDKNFPAVLDIESEPYDPDWTTQLKIQASIKQ